MSGYPPIPPEAFGGARPNEEALRFWRLIDERTLNEDGTQEIVLACGHTSTQIIPLTDSQEYAPCAQCVAQDLNTPWR
jgi:hypothetical protein